MSVGTSGALPGGAVACPTRELQVEERYGLVWLCLGEPARDVPSFPEWDILRGFTAASDDRDASGLRAIEHAIDAPHLPYVHPDVNGVPERRRWLGDLEGRYGAISP